MTEARIFKTNRNQAIRLPKQLAFPEGVTHVEIFRRGDALLVVPSGRSWDDFFDASGVSQDFMAQRDQPAIQQRDGL
jgi:antitoxin VapB